MATSPDKNGQWPEWLNKTKGHLGAQYPFYRAQEHERFFSLRMKDVVDRIPAEERIVDPVGVIEMLMRGYMLANRTLLEGVQRAPWLGIPAQDGGWKYEPLQPHGTRIASPDAIMLEFRAALRQEILHYVEGKKCVGILLSGGLDSRILAGLLRELQLEKDFTGDVIVLTWGLESARDVVYAREIAHRFGWEFVHFPLTVENLAENIEVSAEMGAEIAAFHLHAMPRVRKLPGIELILAGSYGDSVGRAEFSGCHVSNLGPILPSKLNLSGLVQERVLERCQWHLQYDAYGYRKYIDRDDQQHYFEIEQQLHYMRRGMSGAMACIAEDIPLYQLFTAPQSYKVMYNVDYRFRRDSVYKALLPTLPDQIGSMPWARTGKSMQGNSSTNTEQADELLPGYHEYGRWLRQDLRSEVERLVRSPALQELHIFNEYALDGLLKVWVQAKTKTTNSIDSKIAWLASFARFVEMNQVKTSLPRPESFYVKDVVSAAQGVSYAWAYQTAREFFRR